MSSPRRIGKAARGSATKQHAHNGARKRMFQMTGKTQDALAASVRAYGDTLCGAGGRQLPPAACRGDALAAVLYHSPPYDLSVPPMNVARLSINLSPALVTGGLDGERPRTFQARRHSLFLTPAGAAANWRKAASSRHINLYFHAGAFEDDDAPAGSAVLCGREPLLNTALTGAGVLFDMLAAELASEQPFTAEAVDSLARLILVRVARQQAAAGRSNPLTPALLARLTEYVESRLDQRLLVADLAATVGLSTHRFAQAFVDASGQSPHQFVLQSRLNRATQLLRHSSHALADIAASCGFASQQHLTQVMRRRLGITPARERRQAGFTPPGEAWPQAGRVSA